MSCETQSDPTSALPIRTLRPAELATAAEPKAEVVHSVYRAAANPVT